MIRALLCFMVLAMPWIAWSQACDQTAPAVILDEKTRTFVHEITPQMLQIKVGRTAVSVTSLEHITGSRVLILIDDSESMGEEWQTAHNYQLKALLQINRTLRDLLSSLPPNVRVQYGIFHNKAAFAGRFSSDATELTNSRAEVAAQLRHPKNRSTALYDAIHEALAQFAFPQPGDSILVLTDGEDNASVLSPKRVQREATEKGLRLFAILFKRNGPPAQGELGVDSLLGLVEQTGGGVLSVDPESTVWNFPDSTMEATKDIRLFWTDEILAGYVLHFSVLPGLKRDQKWTLSVSGLANPKAATVIAYPRYLKPCALTTGLAH